MHAGRRPRRDRRRELSVVFYFIGGFVLIRIWIFLIESENVLVEAVGAGVTFLLLVALLWRYKILRDREEEEEREQQLHPEVNAADLAMLRSLFRNPQLGLSQEVIDSLLCFKYTEGSELNKEEFVGTVVDFQNSALADRPVVFATTADVENQRSPRHTPEACCSVCLADYVEGDELMMLPCQHAYHKVCVTQWLQRQSQCPLCKQDVLCMLDELGQLRNIATSSGFSQGLGENPSLFEANNHLNGDFNRDTGGDAPPAVAHIEATSTSVTL